MAEVDFNDAQTQLNERMRGGNKPIIGTSAGDLAGCSPFNPNVVRSPCAQLKWLEDNTPYHYEAFVTLTFDGGYQGVRITRKDDGKLVKRLRFPITGGDDADPYKQIPINHRKMMTRLMVYAAGKLGVEI